jgi:hypothetical protein
MEMKRECYWCGRPATSDDHVPAKCFFQKASRRDLMKVPSCDAHNNGFSQIDERFKYYILAASRRSVTQRVDRKLEKQFFEKITRGLYYFHTGARFSGSIKSRCSPAGRPEEDLQKITPEFGADLIPRLSKGHVPSPEVFSYQHGLVEENGVRAFALAGSFYGEVSFLSIGILTSKGV